ncbi:hypothetical protein N7478_010278 [Penicillium angulare]|uniref:uncharacterized protein n=1 Tax=Penicillium angulare TaxID=116970 RepID=UPI00253F9D00|nr:uncharacterized protein N7478_010278 [Penicillium angulare]KAJ5267470.1 hypothetical protein N7478_010278 [Penicillium angulare]
MGLVFTGGFLIFTVAQVKRKISILLMYTSNRTRSTNSRALPQLASGFTKLREQLAKCGEFHSPVPFFEFIPEVARCPKSDDMNANVGRQTGKWCGMPQLRSATIQRGARMPGLPLRGTLQWHAASPPR